MPPHKPKKCKKKYFKSDLSSGTDTDESEHELSYYAKDKVRLMKEILKLIKPKQIKAMAPECIKDLNIMEINSMLLEELLGISNKRLKYIFNGENVDRETSSSDTEEDKPDDVISLDDISDDDVIDITDMPQIKTETSTRYSKKNKSHKSKAELSSKIIKKEKGKEDKKKGKKSGDSQKQDVNSVESQKDKLMSVLELLELQARARAIRSQLAIESEVKEVTEVSQNGNVKKEQQSDSDDVIIESPKHKEILIMSDSEDDTENPLFVLTRQAQQDINIASTSKDIINVENSPEKGQKLDNEKQNETITVDLTNNDKLELQQRQSKLFSKIKKVKLKRMVTIESNSEEKINDESRNVTILENILITTTNTNNSEPINEDKSLEINPKQTDESETTPNIVPLESIKTENHSPKNSDRTTNPLLQQTTGNDCDNDEIVINLDENEMDGIEND